MRTKSTNVRGMLRIRRVSTRGRFFILYEDHAAKYVSEAFILSSNIFFKNLYAAAESAMRWFPYSSALRIVFFYTPPIPS